MIDYTDSQSLHNHIHQSLSRQIARPEDTEVCVHDVMISPRSYIVFSDWLDVISVYDANILPRGSLLSLLIQIKSDT